ncbi:conjugative transfer protein MobI(A/C) [Comamonas jiangduensis]|uniref:conjugative transfer protein MobI(A/C) n=1 Tax=Comamonas jiangduensis TaxID=1194168 RepID=UPI003BF7A35D
MLYHDRSSLLADLALRASTATSQLESILTLPYKQRGDFQEEVESSEFTKVINQLLEYEKCIVRLKAEALCTEYRNQLEEHYSENPHENKTFLYCHVRTKLNNVSIFWFKQRVIPKHKLKTDTSQSAFTQYIRKGTSDKYDLKFASRESVEVKALISYYEEKFAELRSRLTVIGKIKRSIAKTNKA